MSRAILYSSENWSFVAPASSNAFLTNAIKLDEEMVAPDTASTFVV